MYPDSLKEANLIVKLLLICEEEGFPNINFNSFMSCKSIQNKLVTLKWIHINN